MLCREHQSSPRSSPQNKVIAELTSLTINESNDLVATSDAQAL
jgi:hypothetical protein